MCEPLGVAQVRRESGASRSSWASASLGARLRVKAQDRAAAAPSLAASLWEGSAASCRSVRSGPRVPNSAPNRHLRHRRGLWPLCRSAGRICRACRSVRRLASSLLLIGRFGPPLPPSLRGRSRQQMVGATARSGLGSRTNRPGLSVQAAWVRRPCPTARCSRPLWEGTP